MLSEDPDKLSSLLMTRINQCPPAAQAIIETANRCAALRDDLEKDEMDAVFLPLEPMLEVHSQLGGDSEITSVSEEYQALCGLYWYLLISTTFFFDDFSAIWVSPKRRAAYPVSFSIWPHCRYVDDPKWTLSLLLGKLQQVIFNILIWGKLRMLRK